MFKLNNDHTPCHVFDTDQLYKNIGILKRIERETKSTVLYALKGCSQQIILKQITREISGACTSGYNEVLLAEQMGFKEIHTFSTAYKVNEISTIAGKSNVVIFNSIEQYNKYNKIVKSAGAIAGLRINPHYSEIENIRINPCALNTRFGVSVDDMKQLDNCPEYLHFHSMCEQFDGTLERTLEKVENLYDCFLTQAKTVNIGGGQLYTSPDYNVEDRKSVV